MKLISRTAGLLLAAALTVSAVATASSVQAAEQPVSLPAPSGKLPVGLERLQLIDHSRTDPWVPASADRRLMVSIWYPALVEAGRRPQYLTEAEAAALLDFRQLPLDPKAVANIRSIARLDAPPRPTHRKYPLVILSPGFTLPAATLTSLAQDLASKGYVVAGIDHAYESGGTEFPNGRLITCVACEIAEPAQIPPVRAADVSFVLDQLLGRRHPISKLIDPTRIGMAGHSIGGNSTADVMRTDSRIDAGVNLDGTFFTPLPSTGLAKPFLLVGAPGTHTPGDDIDTITRALVTAFFDRHLRGLPTAPILDGTDPQYPEAVRQDPGQSSGR